MIINDVYSHVNYGGWRIGLWEQVGEGQNVTVDFTGKVVGVATGAIVPYVKQHHGDELSFQDFHNIRRLFALGRLNRVVYNSRSIYSASPSIADSSSSMSAAGMYAAGMYGAAGMHAGVIRDTANMVGGIVNPIVDVADSLFDKFF
jgi:hypothetical protein